MNGRSVWTRRVRRGLLVVLCVVLVPFAGSGSAGAQKHGVTEPVQGLQTDLSDDISAWIIQGIRGVTVDAFVGGELVAADLEYGDVASIPSWTPSVGRKLDIRDSDNGTALLTARLDSLRAGDYSLVVVAPQSGVGAPKLVQFPNDIPDPSIAGSGWLSVRNVNLGPSVDLRMNGEIVAVDISTARGVLIPASGWVDISMVADGTDYHLGSVNVMPGLATVGHLVGNVDGDVVWQTLLPTSDRLAVGTRCDGHRVNVDMNAGHKPTAYTDVILGTDQDDAIFASDGDDIVCAGAGNDLVRGQKGNDVILGEAGDDLLRGGDDADHLDGGEGVDDVYGGRGDDVVLGGPGDDYWVRGGTDDDYVDGGPGNDRRINGNGGSDIVVGNSGDDAYVAGGPRPDQVHGGPGDDYIKGLGGADLLFGDGDDDFLFGGKQNDVMVGGAGTDTCSGGAGLYDLVRCEHVTADQPEYTTAAPEVALNAVACNRYDPLAGLAGVDRDCWLMTIPHDPATTGFDSIVTLPVRRYSRGTDAGPMLVLDGDLQAIESPFSGGLTGIDADPNRDFDVITVDLRGTGDATPSLDCPEVDSIAIPAKVVSFRSAQLSIFGAEAACASRLSEEGVDFGQFSAEANADDLVALREQLQIERWDIWAAGSDTLVAQALTRRDPGGVRRVVLQSAMGFGDDLLGANEANSEQALRAVEDACAQDELCSASFPALGRDRSDLYSSLNSQNVTLTVQTTEASYPVAVDGDRFMREILFNLLQAQDGPASIPKAIHDAKTNLQDVTQRGESTVSFGAVGSEGALLASLCQDQFLLARSNKQRCEPWRTPGQIWTDPTTIEWPVPTLILGGAFDPVTPPEWGANLAKSSTLATNVIFADAGTGMVSGPCARQLVRAHLAEEPLDLTCRVDGSGFGS